MYRMRRWCVKIFYLYFLQFLTKRHVYFALEIQYNKNLNARRYNLTIYDLSCLET